MLWWRLQLRMNRARAKLHCSATCATGLDELLIAELAGLGIKARPSKPGTVQFEASTRQLYLANAMSRIANRVLVRTIPFTAHNFDELDRGIATIDWPDWVVAGESVRFRVRSSSSRLYHSGAIEDRLHQRVAELAGTAPASASDDERQTVVVRVVRDQVTISIDSSGPDLHRRGWRQEVGKAPLRETTAAAMLAACGWDGSMPLIDPFCGSGTIPIEAARLARGMAPGLERRFAFHDWPCFEPGTWASVNAHLTGSVRESSTVIIGRDRDEGGIAAARGNAARAGVADHVDFAVASISDLSNTTDSSSGLVLTNPPWGSRLEDKGDLRNLAARLGERVRSLGPDWSIGVLTADAEFARHLGMATSENFRTAAGPTRVRFQSSTVR